MHEWHSGNASVLEVKCECCLSAVALESHSGTPYYDWRNIINTLMMKKGWVIYDVSNSNSKWVHQYWFHCFLFVICCVPLLAQILNLLRQTAANTVILKRQDAQLSQRDRAAGYISFGRKWKTGTGRQYFTDIIGLSSTTVRKSYRIRWKTQNKGY